MMYLVIATLFVAVGLGLMARGYRLSRLPERAYSYRRRYIQIVAQIELAVLKLNSLGNLVPHVKNTRVLDDYESCLRMMETLLTALTRLPNFGFDPRLLGQVVPLVRRVSVKTEETYGKFKRAIEERPLFAHLLPRWQEETSIPAEGCYFCSRPFMKAYFKKASIKVDGIRLTVYGCHICIAQLKARRKIKVLYFLEQGRPVHWSLVDGYKPMEQFWDLNRRKATYKMPEIEFEQNSPQAESARHD
jgi:hypothetical protein